VGERIAFALTGSPLSGAGHVAVDVIGLGTLTYLHLLLGELVPTFVAIQRPERTMLIAALPLRAVDTLFRPLLWVLERSQSAVLRIFGMKPLAEARLAIEW